MTKTCNTCGEIKPEEAFSPNYHGGYRPICKTCRNRIARETRQPIRSEASCSWCGTTFQRSSGQPFNGNAYCSDSCRSVRNRIFKYSLSFSDYRRLLERADGRCEICNAKRTLTIDHCHETGTEIGRASCRERV